MCSDGRALPSVPAPLAHARALRSLFMRQRSALDPVLHHRQRLHVLLRRQRPRHQLDLHDLHGRLHPSCVPRILALGEEG